MEFEEGDIVLCEVTNISKANIFVDIENGKGEGSIVMSEIASGRIKNLREYVVPKKKIVCKILRISGNRIELSLRRVNQKEREERLNQEKQERSYKSVIKAITKDKTEEIIKKIQEKDNIYNFIKKSIKDSKQLEKVAGKDLALKILKIIKEQKQITTLIKKEFILKSTSPEGIELIKEILSPEENKIRYLSAGKYSLKISDKDKKTADKKAQEILEEIEKQAKKKGLEFSIKNK